MQLSRRQYAEMYGPTAGAQIRLADTDLIIQVERDLIAEMGGYGNEVTFGGGKVIRDGMGQSPLALDADCLDLVITNALILDAVCGVIKADVVDRRDDVAQRLRPDSDRDRLAVRARQAHGGHRVPNRPV